MTGREREGVYLLHVRGHFVLGREEGARRLLLALPVMMMRVGRHEKTGKVRDGQQT